MNRGRPRRSESNNLEKEFQKLYNREIGAETAARLVKTDRKTAYKYYKKFSDQIHVISVKNFYTEGVERIKQQTISFDNLLLELYDSLDLINQQINKKSDDTIPQYLQNQKISVIREIKNIIKEKTSSEFDFPVGESIDELIEEVISKHVRV